MKKQNLISLLGVFLLLCFDQVTKYFAVQNLKGKSPFVIIEDVFELHYLENRGAAFGILQNRQAILLFFTLIFLVGMCYLLFKLPTERKYMMLRILGAMLLAGALGNMIDRIRLHYVIDFLYFKLIDFPIFNVADCYVTVAAFGFALLILFYYKEEDFDFLKEKK